MSFPSRVWSSFSNGFSFTSSTPYSADEPRMDVMILWGANTHMHGHNAVHDDSMIKVCIHIILNGKSWWGFFYRSCSMQPAANNMLIVYMTRLHVSCLILIGVLREYDLLEYTWHNIARKLGSEFNLKVAILSDPLTRRSYDHTGSSDKQQMFQFVQDNNNTI